MALEQLPVPGRSLLQGAEEEKQRDGCDRQADQEHVFREREQPAHPGDEPDTASAADDGVARYIERDGENEIPVTEKGGDDPRRRAPCEEPETLLRT